MSDIPTKTWEEYWHDRALESEANMKQDLGMLLGIIARKERLQHEPYQQFVERILKRAAVSEYGAGLMRSWGYTQDEQAGRFPPL